MVTAQVLLRFFHFALLFVDVRGFPVKGSEVQGKPRDPDDRHHVGSQQGSTTGHSVPSSHRSSGGVSKPVKHVGPPQYVQTQPVPIVLHSALPGAEYTPSLDPEQAGSLAGSYLPVQAGYVTGVSEPAHAGYAAGAFVPIQAGYVASPPESGSQAHLPEIEWVIGSKAFEEATTDTQPQETNVGPQLPQAPATLALQSGETSNVVKEAELGNYNQQTEEFGYPSDHMGPGQGIPPVPLPALGVGGLWGSPLPYPDFDYRLLYGLYPPGTYTTFNKEHEKGQDYFQDFHYLKEHGPDTPDTPQNPGAGQQKVFTVTP
ncbi:hypothetical protein CHARACLAT_024417 [Characodon lateralis]|uniref:Uncharacterized protein n=1 Tax=Characodon lateralis TaxID=208331 RepID=A0ABU7F6C1_9TELE|nr:hypothetical protein [Characodon lateralis]